MILTKFLKFQKLSFLQDSFCKGSFKLIDKPYENRCSLLIQMIIFSKKTDMLILKK